MITILIFFAVLFILVLVHEAGHFVAAKRAGVAVDEFGVSFPPRLFGVWRDPSTKKIRFVWGWRDDETRVPAGATLYSFNLIPLGGFVRIKGENGEHEDDPNSFAHKRAGTRAWILTAGVLMNALVAALFLSITFGLGAPVQLEEGRVGRFARVSDQHVEIIYVAEKSPAETAGLKAGDAFVRVGELAALTFQNVRDYFAAHPGEEIVVAVKRGDETIETRVTPAVLPDINRPAIGVALTEIGLVSYPWYIAPLKGVEETIKLTGAIVVGFGEIIRALVRGEDVGGTVAGPVGIAVVTGRAAERGFNYLLQFVALLSLNLAIINILPIPALDGGRLLFVIIEKLRGGKKTRKEIERLAHTIGFAALIALVLIVTFNDVSAFVGRVR